MAMGIKTVNDILSVLEDVYYLSAYDEDTPPEDLKGNLWLVRDELQKIMQSFGWMDDDHVIVDLEFEKAKADYEHLR
jgi:hypothetical protein